MMLEKKTRLKLLVLSELDGQILRVNRLCERLVCSDDSDIDAVLVSGGLVAKRAPREYEALEAVAAAEGDMMALVSRLEMIVCRVLYIPDDNDPPTTRSLVVAPPTLTQYSSNVFSREQQLVDGVVVMGEAHYFKTTNDGKDPTDARDLALVLRDSAARTQLPALLHLRELYKSRRHADTTSSTGSLVRKCIYVLQFPLEAVQQPRHLEVIGGGHHPPSASAPLVFPGSFRLGQFTILELEKQPVDDSWQIAASTPHQLLPLTDDSDDEDEAGGTSGAAQWGSAASK